MQQRDFDRLAGEVGWEGPEREALRLRAVVGCKDGEVAAELDLPLPRVRLLFDLAAERMRRWVRANEDDPMTLAYARLLLECLGNRRKIHAKRTSGPANTGRDGRGGDHREVVPGMEKGSPPFNEWDLVREPPDSSLALPPDQRRRRHEAAEREIREANAGLIPPPVPPPNRRARREAQFGKGGRK